MTCCANRSSDFPLLFPPLSPARQSQTPCTQLLHQGFVEVDQSSQGGQGLPGNVGGLLKISSDGSLDTFTTVQGRHFRLGNSMNKGTERCGEWRAWLLSRSPIHRPEVSFSSPWPQRSLLPGPVDMKAQLKSGAFPSGEAGKFLGPNTLGGT